MPVGELEMGHHGMKVWQSLRAFTILLIAILSLVSQAASAQTPPTVNSLDGQTVWKETQHPVIRTLAELRRMQSEVGKLAYEVDLHAQLTFSARYWSVFFIQDGDIPAMVYCTDAASSILCTQPMEFRLPNSTAQDHPETLLRRDADSLSQ